MWWDRNRIFAAVVIWSATVCFFACDKSDSDGEAAGQPEERGPTWGPPLSDAHMPAQLGELRLSVATEADILAAFPESQVNRDRQFGGEQMVMMNDDPAIMIQRMRPLPDPPEPLHGLLDWTFTLTLDGGETPVMTGFTLYGPAGASPWCDWMRQGVGSDPEATRCRGTNRRFGDEGSFQEYCVGNADGSRRVDVSCDEESHLGGEAISYDLAGP